eukprot:1273781-Rhodomonas_salina.2
MSRSILLAILAHSCTTLLLVGAIPAPHSLNARNWNLVLEHPLMREKLQLHTDAIAVLHRAKAWQPRSRQPGAVVQGGLLPLRGGGAAGKNRVPLSLKILVLFCGGAWFSACLRALLFVAKLTLVPGGLSFLSDRSSHGLPGVFLFVLFAGVLSFVQGNKLVRVLQAKGLEEIRTTLWVQALFNVGFIWQCGWSAVPFPPRLLPHAQDSRTVC